MKKILIVGIINIIFLSLVAFFTYNYVISKKKPCENSGGGNYKTSK